MNLASRIKRLEGRAPSQEPGCPRCRGERALGLDEFWVERIGGKDLYRCAACGQSPGARTAFIGINIGEVI